MKNYFFALLTLGCFAQISAQTTIIPQQDTRVITTGVPFLLIASDARAAGMGDMGVATSPDAYSQQWNPSKYAFSETKSGIAVSYTPYLSKLVNDIFLGMMVRFTKKWYFQRNQSHLATLVNNCIASAASSLRQNL